MDESNFKYEIRNVESATLYRISSAAVGRSMFEWKQLRNEVC